MDENGLQGGVPIAGDSQPVSSPLPSNSAAVAPSGVCRDGGGSGSGGVEFGAASSPLATKLAVVGARSPRTDRLWLCGQRHGKTVWFNTKTGQMRRTKPHHAEDVLQELGRGARAQPRDRRPRLSGPALPKPSKRDRSSESASPTVVAAAAPALAEDSPSLKRERKQTQTHQPPRQQQEDGAPADLAAQVAAGNIDAAVDFLFNAAVGRAPAAAAAAATTVWTRAGLGASTPAAPAAAAARIKQGIRTYLIENPAGNFEAWTTATEDAIDVAAASAGQRVGKGDDCTSSNGSAGSIVHLRAIWDEVVKGVGADDATEQEILLAKKQLRVARRRSLQLRARRRNSLASSVSATATAAAAAAVPSAAAAAAALPLPSGSAAAAGNRPRGLRTPKSLREAVLRRQSSSAGVQVLKLPGRSQPVVARVVYASKLLRQRMGGSSATRRRARRQSSSGAAAATAAATGCGAAATATAAAAATTGDAWAKRWISLCHAGPGEWYIVCKKDKSAKEVLSMLHVRDVTGVVGVGEGAAGGDVSGKVAAAGKVSSPLSLPPLAWQGSGGDTSGDAAGPVASNTCASSTNGSTDSKSSSKLFRIDTALREHVFKASKQGISAAWMAHLRRCRERLRQQRWRQQQQQDQQQRE